MKKNWIKIAGATFGMAVALQVTPAFADGAEGNLSTSLSVETNVENDVQLKEAAETLLNDVKSEGTETVSFLRSTVQTEAEQLKSEVEEGKAAVNEQLESVVKDVADGSNLVDGLSTDVESNVEVNVEESLSLIGTTEVHAATDSGLNTTQELEGLLNEANQNVTNTVDDVTTEVTQKVEQTVDATANEIDSTVQKTVSQTENAVNAAKDSQVSVKAEAVVEAEGKGAVGQTEAAGNTVTTVSVETNNGSLTAQSEAGAAVAGLVESGSDTSAEGSFSSSTVIEGNTAEAAFESEATLQSSAATSTKGAQSKESVNGAIEANGGVESSVKAEEQSAEANANFDSTVEADVIDGHVSTETDAEATGEIAA